MKAVTGEGGCLPDLLFEALTVGHGDRAEGTQVVGVRGTGDTDDGRTSGECELCDEASHSPGGCGDHDDVAGGRLHAAHGSHRGLRGNA